MNLPAFKILILTEARLRLRRLSTLAAMLGVSTLGWWMFADQSSGYAFVVVDNALVQNTSSTLALGSVSLFSLILGLAGFFLARGRIAEDVRCGASGVIGASTVSNASFLFCRWLGGVGYLLVMACVFMLTMMVCHLFRGVGPIQPWVYIKTYLIILLPVIGFCVSCAVLFDSVAPLMGKLGDVIYVVLWVAQFSAMSKIDDLAFGSTFEPLSILQLLDFSGVAMIVKSLAAQLHTTGVSLGYASFDPKLPALTLGDDIWSRSMVLSRLVSAGLASLILFPAFLFFHRYSTDKIKVSLTKVRRSPIAILNHLTRPLTRLAQPLFRLAGGKGGKAGIVGLALADVALTLCSAPTAILAVMITFVCAIFFKAALLPGLLIASIAIWGVIVSDVSTRDFFNGCEQLTGVVAGGVNQRYLRQFGATFLLGLLFTGTIGLRLLFQHPLQACAMVVGLLSLSALSSLFGRTARSSRLFLSLFLFWLYVATQVPNSPLIDLVAFNDAENVISTSIQLCIALIALISGYCYNRWQR